MEKKAYHHENLRQELIDAGVKIVAQEGIRALSLRRLAAECNVSHAAPYKHFKNKDDILAALTQHVQQLFAQKLLDGLNALENSDPQERLVEMGVNYVRFMVENPEYLKFLFFTGVTGRAEPEQLSPDAAACGDSLAIFRDTAVTYLQSAGVDSKHYEYDLIAMWGLVHGLSVMRVNRNWVPAEPYPEAVRTILRDRVAFL